jgi:hypothetical protein
MKSIKPIVLKEAKFLSNEEMKHIFGGSAVDTRLTAECNPGATCTITDGSTSYTGTCSAVVTSSSISCTCKFSGGAISVSGTDSACFSVKP